MAQVMPWGGTYRVTAELGYAQTDLTLNDATLGQLNTGGTLSTGLLENDLTDRIQNIQITRGRNDQFQDFSAGTCVLTLNNNDRALDPLNRDSPFFNDALDSSGVTIRRKIVVYYDSTPIFTGRITDIDISYEPTSNIGTRSTVTIEASDNFLLLASTVMEEYLPSNQLGGARIASILSLPEVNFLEATNLDTGTVLMLDDPVAEGTVTLQALQAVSGTERGYLFCKGDGTLRFTSRVTAGPVSPTIFADNGTGIDYATLSIVYGQESLFNRIICTPIDSVAPGIAENNASQVAFGISTLNLSGLLCSDANAQVMADYLLDFYENPSYRFDGLSVVFAGSKVSLANQQTIIGLDLGTIIRCVKSFTTGRPTVFQQNAIIERIAHTITPTSHAIQYFLSPAPFSTLTRTATGSGTGSQVTVGVVTKQRTASGTGSATAGDSATGVHIAPRTASASGQGSQTADGIGFTTESRTATGSGAGSQTADGVVRVLLFLDDAINGKLDANALGEYNRVSKTATGTGGATASDSATGVKSLVRTATGSGVGSSSAIGLTLNLVVLDNSVFGQLDNNRLGDAIAILSRTATGSGAGSGSADSTISLVLILNSASVGKLDTNTLSI